LLDGRTVLIPSVTAILRLVTAQRDDTQIDEALVKKVVDSFVSLGLYVADPDKEGLDAYKDQFGGVSNTRNNVVCFGPPTRTYQTLTK
jgi:hypothetical protein